jgi:hypothetical protein
VGLKRLWVKEFRRFKMKKCMIVLMVVLMALMASFVQAETNITFTWDQEISPDFAGWRLYTKTDLAADYPDRDSEEFFTIPYSGTPADSYEKRIVIPAVEGDTTFYFVVTAFDTSDNESDYSNQVFTTIKDETPPGEPQSFILTIVQE